MKTQLNAELDLITDPGLHLLARRTLDSAPECFWTMPASTTGKHHPASSLGQGGLIRHTRSVVRIATHLLTMADITPVNPIWSCVITAAILHDCVKKTDTENHTSFTHPLAAADLIRSTARDLDKEQPNLLTPELVKITCAAVRSHMGRWCTSKHSHITLPIPVTAPERIVHTADYLASREDITIARI